jgi:hypothetical protein
VRGQHSDAAAVTAFGPRDGRAATGAAQP